jgi:hypothetical protein
MMRASSSLYHSLFNHHWWSNPIERLTVDRSNQSYLLRMFERPSDIRNPMQRLRLRASALGAKCLSRLGE